MEMEQVKKVVRLDENPMGNEEQVKVDDGGDERDHSEISDMDKLPPEILIKILDYLDEQQLVKCRLLSTRWNEISCLLLQDQTKNKSCSSLIVKLSETFCRTVITKSIEDFIESFALSEAEKSSSSGRRRPCPFSRFTFQRLKYLNLAQMGEFVSAFGPHMKIVRIKIGPEGIPNFEKLWKLLLHFAPNIQHLRLKGGIYLPDINLVDPVTKSTAKADPNFKPWNNLSFLKLKVLEIESQFYGAFNDFMKDVLSCTPNLEVLTSKSEDNFDLKSLRVWHKLNKAHCVKTLEMSGDYHSDLSPADLMKNLRLESLTADFGLSSNYVETEKSVSNYIYHALKSSAETLLILNLNYVTLENLNRSFKDTKSLPNVRQLQLDTFGSSDRRNVLSRLSQICPNIKNLTLAFVGGDVSDVAPILWTRFAGLKSLKLTVDMRFEQYVLHLDSGISGYSRESIQKIQAKLDQGISLEEARQNEKQNPSILDLKDLSRLQLLIYIRKRIDNPQKQEEEVRNSVFVKILPQHIREYPRTISYEYFD